MLSFCKNIVLIFVFSVPSLSAEFINDFYVKKFDQNPGIYFENIGQGDIVTNSWKLVIYYDMKNYWKEYDGFKVILNKMNKLCEISTNTGYCNAVLNQLRADLMTVQYNNDLIFPRTYSKKNRSKRGLFNFVGTYQNFLYGTLDQNYADKMEETIEKAKQNEAHNLELIKNQTSVIESTVNLLKKTDKDVSDQFESVNKELNRLLLETNSIKLDGQFATLAIHTSLIISSYRQLQTAILNVLLESNNGKISPLILNPNQLEKELIFLRKYMPKTLKLPNDVQGSELLSLYGLMTINGCVEKDKIKFLVQLPLVINENFEIYVVRPIPQFINAEFSIITSTTKYILTNLHFDQFYLMSSTEFNNCQSINANKVICKQEHPIYNHQASADICEIGLMVGNHESLSENCQVTANNKDAWIQLNDPNHWLFSVRQKMIINVVCKGKLNRISIEKCGIIILSEDCLIRHDGMLIHSHQNFPASMRKPILPTVNSVIFSNMTNVGVAQINVKYSQHNKTLNQIETQIQQLRNNEKLPNSELQRSHNIHLYTVGYISLAVTCIIAYFFFRRSSATSSKTKINTTNLIEIIEPNRNSSELQSIEKQNENDNHQLPQRKISRVWHKPTAKIEH